MLSSTEHPLTCVLSGPVPPPSPCPANSCSTVDFSPSSCASRISSDSTSYCAGLNPDIRKSHSRSSALIAGRNSQSLPLPTLLSPPPRRTPLLLRLLPRWKGEEQAGTPPEAVPLLPWLVVGWRRVLLSLALVKWGGRAARVEVCRTRMALAGPFFAEFFRDVGVFLPLELFWKGVQPEVPCSVGIEKTEHKNHHVLERDREGEVAVLGNTTECKPGWWV